MLIELRLENYAVIDNLGVEFGPGLNLLTGETGAGKSILIDSLALLLGEKASIDVIRAGADRAVVSAIFEPGGQTEKSLAQILEANGLDESDDGSLILRREIATGGKGRVFVNNQPATVAVLRLRRRIWRSFTHRMNPFCRLTGRPDWNCWTHSWAASSGQLPPPTLRVDRFEPASRSLSAVNRTA